MVVLVLVRFVLHSHVVKDIILLEEELEENDTDWPNVYCVSLLFESHYRLKWHE